MAGRMATSSGKETRTIASLLPFLPENGWIEDSPVRHLKAPISKDKPTLPFTREEMARILEMRAMPAFSS